ncbi:unnamed protein product [Symbiodinium natans]|uniref:Uncharacterized protein n=1 Tax=Symbiodinium natans TaxID=878477 RepID=A0A812H786_9DINO|nr:unnamed protein product [Symbiodinium natans]
MAETTALAPDDEGPSSTVRLNLLEVPPLNLPQNLLHFMQRDEMKEPAKPADLLIPLTPLNEEHTAEAAQTERAGHGRCNQRFRPFLHKPARSARNSVDLKSARVAQNQRQRDLSPITAAREATSKQAKRRSRRGRGGDAEHEQLPLHREIDTGWRDLLGEIATSSRRVRLARGGQSTILPPSSGRSPSPELRTSPEPETARARSRTRSSSASPGPQAPPRPDSAQDDGLWLSYRITEEKVPTAILTKLWKLAVDPRKDEGIAPLERVPRLTVTKREVQALPTVQDILQWRRCNLRRREQRKLRREAERNPTLDEMLISIFGEPEVEKLYLAETHNQRQRAEILLQALMEEIGSPSAPTFSARQRQAQEEELTLLREVNQLLSDDVVDATRGYDAVEPKLLGSRRRGRRGAFDEGKASAKLALSIADLQARQDKNVVRSKKLRRGVEHSRALQAISPDTTVEKYEKAAEGHMQEVVKTCTSIFQKCQKRADGFHSAFVRRQGSLSERLQRRVKRLQYDHTEIQQMKEQSILPSVIGQPQSNSESANLSVLHFLKPHRVHVERRRQEAHSIYMAQVEKIQHYQRLLADPNRDPDRGEVYLSRCFRYVLSAGLAVDAAYFFRVLAQMEREDFEKAWDYGGLGERATCTWVMR